MKFRANGVSRLFARFDTAVLQPPPPSAPGPPATAPCFGSLRTWCLAGAAPRMTLPLAMAVLSGDPAQTHRLAVQLCLERDGSLQMQSLGAAGRVALRLKTKACDLMPGRDIQSSDAWDAGTLIDSAAGLHALRQFSPRRATLMLADRMPAEVLQAVLNTLTARQSSWSRPVRLLILGEPATAHDRTWPRFTAT